MARALTAGMLTELNAALCRPVFFYEGVFASFTLRLCNLQRDISWNSQTWLGNGWLREFPGARESDDFAKNNLSVVISGIPDTMLSLIFSGTRQGASGKLWLGMLNSSGAVIADPYLLFEGKLDVPILDEGQEDSEITLTYENEYTSVNRSKDFRWEPETQKIFYPNDLGFQYITPTNEFTGTWGPRKQKPKKKKKSPQPRVKRGTKK